MHCCNSQKAILTTFEVVICLCLAFQPADAQELARFYAGLGFGAADYSGSYESIEFSDVPTTLQAFGGVRFSDQWSIELAYLDVGEARSGTIRGSGVQIIQLSDRMESTSLSAVRQFSLSEAFQWRNDIRVFGSIGVNTSKTHAGEFILSANDYLETESTDAGVLAGLGIVYGRPRFAIRGYLQWFDVMDGGMTNFGVAAEFGF